MSRMENDLNPKVKTLFDADNIWQHDTTELKQICREQEDRIEDHELRITRLEKQPDRLSTPRPLDNKLSRYS